MGGTTQHPPLAPVEGPLSAIFQLHDVAVCVHRMELPGPSVCRIAMTSSSTMRRASLLAVGVEERVPATLVLIPGTRTASGFEGTRLDRRWPERTGSRLRCGKKKSRERDSQCATCKAPTTLVRSRQHSTVSRNHALH